MPGPGPDQSHLWIVLTDPDPDSDKVVAVMVVSEKPHTDKTTSLNVGDHPFIERSSNIDYGTANHFPRSKLEGVISSKGKLRQDLSPALLEKARAGVFDSSRCPNFIKEYFEPRFGVDGKVIPPKPSPPSRGARRVNDPG